ncbi:MAG: DUF3179 domain-containing (seleno)protein, partial [Planctomycetota bacterium]
MPKTNRSRRSWLGFSIAAAVGGFPGYWQSFADDITIESASDSGDLLPIAAFLGLNAVDKDVRRQALYLIERNFRVDDVGMLLESIRMNRHLPTQDLIFELLARNTNGPSTRDLSTWYRWLWNQNVKLHPQYADFKSRLYDTIDPRFAEYFDPNRETMIRLDEIRWGGVVRDGIPPLDHPELISAPEATYLDDTNVVFGVFVNGVARAYPKRILAWHEMVRDNVGGREINGVYCTLCGSMIVYDPIYDGVHHRLGTSGFLYRSNKLMYDAVTKSMWSTLKGKPVMGPLVGKGIKLGT